MRIKLLAFSLVLLALPWLGWRYLAEMQTFLLEGRQQTQSLSAQALANVLAARPALFPTHAAAADAAFIYARPLPEAPLIDGHDGDWGPTARAPWRQGGAAGQFRWQLAGHRDWLYLLVQVNDRRRTFRHPGLARLDYSDHLRLLLKDASGSPGSLWRVAISSEGPGAVDVEVMADGWRYPLHGGAHLPIDGSWLETADGYQVELRLPLEWLHSLAIGVADADAGAGEVAWSPAITTAVDTNRRPSEAKGIEPGRLEPEPLEVAARSPAVQRLSDRFGGQQGRVTVVDRQRWVLASNDPRVGPRLPQHRVGAALTGTSRVWRTHDGASFGDRIIAAEPIRAERPRAGSGPGTGPAAVLGAVVIDRGVDDLLALQWRAFLGITLEGLGLMLLLMLGLLLFASRLAWRIRRLSRATDAAIDADGQVLATHIRAEARSGDELGGLSRHISAMLVRLQRFTGFLRGVPRTLRHELNNPLNVISTSLQNLGDTHPELAHDRYLQAAGRGVARMERIVHSLTEAAGLEQSLRGDPMQRFDLAALVSAYVTGSGLNDGSRQLDYQGPDQGMPITGSDLRIEQLLDKLVDNARDFTPADGTITVILERDGSRYRLQVINDGSDLPGAILGHSFDAMVSVRAGSDPERPHLGIGLFVARAIAEHHGGTLTAANRTDGAGAVFSVCLPR